MLVARRLTFVNARARKEKRCVRMLAKTIRYSSKGCNLLNLVSLWTHFVARKLTLTVVTRLAVSRVVSGMT